MHRLLQQSGKNLVEEGELEKLRREQRKIAELKRRNLEATLVPRDQVRGALMVMSDRLRQFGGIIERDFGPAAHELWIDGLDDVARHVDDFLSETEAKNGAAESLTN